MVKFADATASGHLLSDISPGALMGETADSDDVAARLARFETHAAVARQVAIYHFAIPPGATVPSARAGGAPCDARDQLHLVLAMTGGAIGKRGGEICVRAPGALAPRFEILAWPLIEAFLVAFRRDGIDEAAQRKVRKVTE